MFTRAERYLLALGNLHGNSVLLALFGILGGQRLTTGEIVRQFVVPRLGAETAKQLQCYRFDLIDRFWAINGSIWCVRVIDGDSGLHELMHSLPAKRFSRVWGIFFLVVLPRPIHDRCNAHKGIFRSTPFLTRRQVQQCKQA